MKRLTPFVVLLACLLISAATVFGEPTMYFDEVEYLGALTAQGDVAVYESFEDDDYWSLARSPLAAPDVPSQGVTWTGSGGGAQGVTTGSGPARTGDWGFYSSPHGDLPAGITDGFTVTTRQPMSGFAGWIEGTHGADIRIIIDGDELNPIGLGEICELDEVGEPFNCVDRNVSNTPFVGLIDPTGFTRLEIRETEAGGDELQLLFADDFTVGFPTLPSIRTPGTAWIDPAGGVYANGTKWEAGAPPATDENAVFNLASAAAYTVSLSQDQTASQMVVANDRVHLDLGGNRYELTQTNVTRESILVGELPGDSSELTVEDGVLSGVNLVVGHSSGTTGHLTVSTDGTLSAASQLRVGSGGTGMLDIVNGGHVTSSLTRVGQLSGSGTVHVTGLGATLTSAGNITVGSTGYGAMDVTSGGQVTSATAHVGVGADGDVLVDGAKSNWTITGVFSGDLEIGAGDGVVFSPTRTGTLTIQNRGSVSAVETRIGSTKNGYGIVTVTGPDSSFDSGVIGSGNTLLGPSGDGELNVLKGASVETGQTLIYRGVANVDGADSIWTVTSSVWVGYNGLNVFSGPVNHGELNVTHGGVVSASAIAVSERNHTEGLIHVGGAGSMLSAANSITVGGFSTPSLNASAEINVDSGGTLSAGSTLRVRLGDVNLNDGTINATSFELHGGRLTGVGQVNADVKNVGGIVGPGATMGILSINGSYTQGGSGRLEIEIAGVGLDTEYHRIHVDGNATLAGQLDISFDSYTPVANDSFDIVSALDLDGAFHTVGDANATLPGGLVWRVDYVAEPSVAQLVVTLPGDMDLNGNVDFDDIDDFVMGLNDSAAYLAAMARDPDVMGDMDGNGNQDFDDIAGFVAVLTGASAGGRPEAVPEPATLLLTIVALLAILTLRGAGPRGRQTTRRPVWRS